MTSDISGQRCGISTLRFLVIQQMTYSDKANFICSCSFFLNASFCPDLSVLSGYLSETLPELPLIYSLWHFCNAGILVVALQLSEEQHTSSELNITLKVFFSL